MVDPQHRGRLGVDHAGAVLGHGADPVLGVVRGAELAHGKDLQRRAERGRDLVGHGHAPTRQRHHHRPLGGERREVLGQLPPGVAAVGERLVGAVGLGWGHCSSASSGQ